MTNARLNTTFATHLLALLVCTSNLFAQVEGPGGHYYHVVMQPGITWQSARQQAEEAMYNGVHGHLATITSQEEDLFIESLRQQAAPGGYGALWIGGAQESSAPSAQANWFWVNGEGPVPMNGSEGYANWQAGEPNDYNGPGSENFLSAGHFNSFGWNDEGNGGQVHGYVIEYSSGGTAATVGVHTVDPIATENSQNSTAPVDPGVFEFYRTGDLSLDLPVFYSIHGTAMNGIDYNEIARSIIIPAGQSAVRLSINPRTDALTVVEKMETVGIRIEPSLILTPEAAYKIELENREAAVVIVEGALPQSPTLEIAVPKNGATYKSGEVVTIVAVAYAVEPVASVDFYSGEIKLGTATRNALDNRLSFFKFSWNGPGAGSPDLYAKAQIGGAQVTSSSVRIVIEQTSESPVVGIRYVDQPIATIAPHSDYVAGYFEVTRVGPITQNLQVFYSVTGTATADVDYERLQGYVVIGAGRSSARINVAVKDDLIDEPVESVIASLVPLGPSTDPTSPANYTIDPERRNATLPIFDNDPPETTPVISLSVIPSEIVEPGGTLYPNHTSVTVSRTGSTQFGQRVYLRYEGSATPDVDFGRAVTEVVIPAGSAEASFPMAALPDSHVEGTELAIIRIAIPQFPTNPDPANREYQISSEKGSATLKVHDAQSSPVLPVVSIHKLFGVTHEPSPEMDVAPAVFALRRTGPTNISMAVFLSYGGSASNGVDYVSPGRSVGFKPGQSEVRVEIYATDDALVEGNETIVVHVDPAPAGISSPYVVDPENRSVTLEIIDNEFQGNSLVAVEAVDPIAIEPSPGLAISDTGEFLFTRFGGDQSHELRVWFSLHGTAKNGEDYSLPNSIVIPAGQNSVRLQLIPIADGGGGEQTHHYQFITAPGIQWEQARAAAEATTYEGVQGHLATITSAEEDAHIHTLREQAGMQVLWVGGYQEPGEMSISEGWKWVNNEGPIPGQNGSNPYANWLAGEPNDYWGAATENHMVIGWLNSFGWNDQNAGNAQGYVIEFDLTGTGGNSPNEKMETVAVRLEPSPLLSPLPDYHIDAERRVAVAVIFEHQAPADGAVEVALPGAGFNYTDEDDVDFYVAAYHPTIVIDEVSYYIFGQHIGSSERDSEIGGPGGGLEFHRFRWTDAYPGTFILQARANLEDDQVLVSSEIPFTIRDGTTNLPPIVSIVKPADGAVFIVGEAIEVLAQATDPEGANMTLTLRVDDLPAFSTNGTSLSYVLANLAAGPHTITVRAVDPNGATGEQTVNILVRHPDAISFVERDLPASYVPGSAFQVQLRARPHSGTHAYAVEDQPPQGWVVSEISHEGVFDPMTGKVKFGPFTDSSERTLTYAVTPPGNASGRYRFVGRSSANGASYPITGDEFVELAQQYHPADLNRSFSIVLEEATGYAAAWKTGESWPSGPVPIPLDFVTSAGKIWKRGEEYHFDPTRGPAPACWVPSSEGLSVFAANGGATRVIKGIVQPGVGTQVQLSVSPGGGTSCHALEEKPPRGWTISAISHGGTYDAESGSIRWGVFMDATERTLTYVVTPQAGVTAVGNFNGYVSFDGQLAQVGQSTSVVAEGSAPMHIIGYSQTGSGVVLQIVGPAGQTAVVESTSDFANWTNISSIFIPDGAVEFIDKSAGAENRFYRLRVE